MLYDYQWILVRYLYSGRQYLDGTSVPSLIARSLHLVSIQFDLSIPTVMRSHTCDRGASGSSATVAGPGPGAGAANGATAGSPTCTLGKIWA